MAVPEEKMMRVNKEDHDILKHLAVDCGVSLKKMVNILVTGLDSTSFNRTASRGGIKNSEKSFAHSLPQELRNIIYSEEKNVRIKN